MQATWPGRTRFALIRSASFLLLGCITMGPATYVIAWLDWREHGGSAPSIRRFDVVEAGEVVGHAYVLRADTFVNIGRLCVMPPSIGGCIACPSWASASPPNGFTAVSTFACGWPLRWARSEGWVDHDATPPRLVQAGWHGWTGVLPLGFAGNTVVFALFWAALAVTFVRTRRSWRRRRGRCPMCAYSLAGLADAGCPECGWLRVRPA